VVRLAWAAIAAQVVFVGGWLVSGAIEGHGYSPRRDDISDLGALTAHHVWFNLTTLAVAGIATIAFAIFALRPALERQGLKQPLSAWLVALSLPALDNLSDVFVRLDCRARGPRLLDVDRGGVVARPRSSDRRSDRRCGPGLSGQRVRSRQPASGPPPAAATATCGSPGT